MLFLKIELGIMKLMNKKKEKPRLATNLPTNRQLNPNDWTVIPVGLLSLLCLYVFTLNIPGLFNLSNLPYFIFMQPVSASLFVALFGGFYIFSVIRRRTSYVATVIAYIFSISFILFFIGPLLGKGQTCSGFFHSQIDCSEANSLKLTILLLNPYSLLLWNVLAVTGIITLFAKNKHSNKKVGAKAQRLL